MPSLPKSFGLFILLAGLFAKPVFAETFHTCGTIIASVPTVITTAGVYCLNHDVNTAITSGNAITINSNNVTLDCNGYKIGGLAAGATSTAHGVGSDLTRQNITVRNCGVRGFYTGIALLGGAGHLVADNRLDNNLVFGIVVGGYHNLIEHNRVYDTGGFSGGNFGFGIDASGDVIDNIVDGTFGATANNSAYGIEMDGDGTEARGNRVSGLLATGTGSATGLDVFGVGVTVRDNSIAVPAASQGNGIAGLSATDTVCIGNTTLKFATAITQCQDGGGNVSN